MKADLKENIEIPQGVEVKAEKGVVTTKGPKGEVTKNLLHPKIKISVAEGNVIVESLKATKREKTLIGTYKAHIKNMIQGVQEGHVYTLKICSSHFPMRAAYNNNEFSVKNYLGEKTPRVLKIREGVTVKIEGEIITVESPDKELAGQTAASIEKLTMINNRDRRIFQDGIYLTSKAGKKIE